MAGTFKFELVSPERMLMSEDAVQVILMGTEGQMTILPGHAPLVTSLRPGVVEVTSGGKVRRLYIAGGFAEIDPERLTLLAEKAYDTADIRGSALDTELRAAEQSLADAKTDEARLIANTAIESLTALRSAR